MVTDKPLVLDHILFALSAFPAINSGEHATTSNVTRPLIHIIPEVLFIASFILLIIGLVLYRKKKKQDRAIRLRYKEKLTLYFRSEKEIESEKQKLQVHVTEKQKEIDLLREKLSAYQQEETNNKKISKEHVLLGLGIVTTLQAYANVGTVPSDREWEKLEEAVKRLIPEFYNSIYNSRNNLSYKEKRLCVLTKLNFQPSSIANLFNMTKQSVSNMRRSVNQKLFRRKDAKSFDVHVHAL